jgi:hypothetical protein
MFEPASRYYQLETVTYTGADGRIIAYKRRRFLPIPVGLVILAEHMVTQGDRLDNITARYLGNPEQFWQLCDINNAMHPKELTAEIGRKLYISAPQV